MTAGFRFHLPRIASGSLACVAAGLLALGAAGAQAQVFPSKPVRLITAGAGTSSDSVARLIGQSITAPLGQPVVIDNRPAGDVVALSALQYPPDGHTVFFEGSGLWLRPLMQASPYDFFRDFQPVTQAMRQPALLVVAPGLPIKSVKDLIAYARARPGELNYATGSTGSLAHLAAELFQSMTDTKLQKIDYKNGAQGVIDLLAGRVQLMFVSMALAAPHVKAGKLTPLGVSSAQPSELAPGVPTIASNGLPGFESLTNLGIFASSKVPRANVDRLNQEIVKGLFSPQVKDRMLALGLEPVGGTPEQLTSVVKGEIETIGKVIRERGIKFE